MFEGAASRILLPALLDVSIKATVITVALLLVLRLLRVKDVALRHAIWCTVLLGMLTLPLWSAFLPAFSLPVLPVASPRPEPAVAASGSPLAASGAVTPVRLLSRETAAPAPGRPSGGGSLPWGAWAALLYLAVSSWMLCRLVVGLMTSRRLLAGARPVTDSRWVSHCRELVPSGRLRRTPTLWSSPALRVPVTTGWLRPRILLPAGWPEWSEQKMVAVLSHEAAHVRRGDFLYQVLGMLNRCLYWFHPLAWILPRHISALAEQACDADAVRSTRDRVRYASYLLEVASSLGKERERVSLAYLAMARSSRIGSRINAVLAGAQPARRLGRVTAAVVYLTVAGLWLGASTLRLAAAGTGAGPAAKVGAAPAAKGPVVTAGLAESSLERAWSRAAGEASRRGLEGGFWIGYGIERPAGAVQVVGSDSQAQENDSFAAPGAGAGAPSGRVGFFFRLAEGGSTGRDVTRIKIDDLASGLDLGGETLLWLGAWPGEDSLAFLQELEAGLQGALRQEIPQAVALHAVAGDEAVARLVETARHDRSGSLREEAIQGLGVLRTAPAVAALVDLARTAGSADARRAAAFQLGDQDSREAVDVLAALVYDDPDQKVQEEALDALARSRTPEAREALTGVAGQHPEEALRAEARELLQRGRRPR